MGIVSENLIRAVELKTFSIILRNDFKKTRILVIPWSDTLYMVGHNRIKRIKSLDDVDTSTLTSQYLLLL